MTEKIPLGRAIDGGGDIGMDLVKLIPSRLLVQANSGAGKSRTIRRLLEQSHSQIQQIVLDIEGDFATLRERYDYILASKGGDIEVSLKVAKVLAERLLELRVSAIIDLYELKQHERILFVKRFLEAMMNAPKRLWHPCMVVVDEAHILCPERGKAESMSAVIDLCTRGRKRGYCAVLATQRLSKLHKDAAAELLNKLIGRTGLDLDVKRASDELGFTTKEQALSLRTLKPGEFYAFGPAISDAVTRLQVGDVHTTHPEAGSREEFAPPPPTPRVRQLLGKLNDLPQEAEEEARTVEDLKAKVRSLQRELRTKPKPAAADPRAEERAEKRGYNAASKEYAAAMKDWEAREKTLRRQADSSARVLAKISQLSADAAGVEPPAIATPAPAASPPPRSEFRPAPPSRPVSTKGGGETRMLRAAVMYHPDPITRMRMATLSGLSHKSGTFTTYLGKLRANGLIEDVERQVYVATDAGVETAGDVDPLPTDPEQLVQLWQGIVKGGAARMLQVLADAYPEEVSRLDLAERAELTANSGTFTTYLGKLRGNGLIIGRDPLKAAPELFGD